MTMYEIYTMERDKCIVTVAGLPPFFSDKYDATTHPRFKYTGDADEKNIFDFQKYRKKLKEREDVLIHFKKKEIYRAVKIK